MEENIERMEKFIEFTADTVETLTSIREELYSLKRNDWQNSLREIRNDLTGDTLMVFIGEFSSGKSTFINALLGTNILPTASKPCTCVVTEVELISDGGGHRGKIIYLDNKDAEERSYKEIAELIDGSTGVIGKIASVHHVELKYDISSLDNDESPLKILEQAKIKLIDTPGFNSPYGMNEAVVMEYLEKSKYSFWLFPNDKIGGTVARNLIADIKRKGIEIIPIITKSDRIGSEEEKEEIKERFSEYFSSFFIMKEPRFVSAYKALEAIEKSKKRHIHNSELKDEIAKLNEESGLEAVARDLLLKGTNKVLNKNRINAAGGNLSILITILKKHLKDECSYWEKSLTQKGWVEDDKYKKINDIRKSLEKYNENEAAAIAKEFESVLCERVLRVLSVKKTPSALNNEINAILQAIKEEILKDRLEKVHIHIIEKYRTDLVIMDNGDPIDINSPDFSNFQSFFDVVLSFVDSLKYAGPTSLVTGSIGVAIIVSLDAISKITILGTVVGAPIATVAGFLGGGLLLFAIFPLIPAIVDSNRKRSEKAKQQVAIQIRDWTRTIKIEYAIRKSIHSMIVNVHELLTDKMDRDINKEQRNYETAKTAYDNLCSKEQELRTIFNIKQ